MTTHLRTRAIQVGALLALAGGMIAVASTPALADPPEVQINNVSATDLPAGGRATLRYTVTNQNNNPGLVRIQVNGGGMNCSGDCSPAGQLGPNESRQFTIQLTAPQVGDGQTRNITVQVNAAVNNENASANQQFTVRGNDKPKTVRQVTGRVKDQDGKSVSGAEVGVRDSQGHSYRTTTNNDGRFAFTSSDSQPILAGTLTVGAVKSGFTQVTVSVQGTADKTLNVPLTLQGTAVTASPTPSASITASAPPTDEATDPATDAATGAATAPATDAASAKGSGSNSTLYIILGALLVAAGVGAIVLVLMRRKSGGDDDDYPDDDNVPVGGGPVPPSRGAFHDATRVGAPVGAGRNDATMIAQGGPSISDAPTMMQRAVPLDDEFPDPYGAPVPQAGYPAAGAAAGGGYGAANQYGNATYGGATVPAQSGGYDPGPSTQFGQPPIEDDPYAAYGAPAGAGNGYGAGGAQQRFDEPTGMYRPESAGGYADQGYRQEQGYGQDQGYSAGGGYPAGAQPGPGGYGREPEPEYPAPRGERTGGYQAGSYGGASYGGQEPAADQGGYGSWNAPADGIDNGNAYAPPARGGDYGASGGGYGGAGGAYGGQGSSYGAPASGYGADDDGYDQRGGYGGGQPYERGGNGYGGGAPAGGYTGGTGGTSTGGYGGGDQGGYPDQGGYGGGGQGRGYGADQGGGYDDAAGGGYYGTDDQRGGGRHGGQSRPPQPETTRHGQRRPLDWLDD